MNIQKINIEKLIPATYNPRKDLQAGDEEYEKIKRSIEHFGYIDPVIINSDMTVIGGHQRIKVLKDLGYQEVECVVVDLSKDEEKALNIALNKISGEWDEEKLADLLKEINAVGISELTGFSIAELKDIIGTDEVEEIQEDDFDIDEVLDESEPIIQLGDIVELGRHKFICGDSTEESVIKALMEDKKADLIITDPPYNVNYEGSNGMKIKNDNMEESKFYQFILQAYKNMFEASRAGTPIYVFHADTEGASFRKALVEAGFKYAQCLVWVKNAMTLGRQDYQWRHEAILYGWIEGAKHYFIDSRENTTVIDDGMPDTKGMSAKELRAKLKEYIDFIFKNNTVLYEDKPVANDLHPTMKPLKLLGKLMHNSSKADDTVLDLFLGSGSTLITAEQLNRTCYGVELDPRYADAIVQRYIEFKGDTKDIFITRNGKKIEYKKLAK